MSTPLLTLAEARAATYDTVVYSDTDPKYKEWLNHLLRRFIDSGEWQRSNFVVELPVVNGHFTLPRRAAALLGVRFSNGSPRTVYPQAHEFLEAGPGEQKPDTALRSVYETPDVCTQTELGDTPLTLSIVSSSALDTSVSFKARLYGVDSTGKRLFTASTGAEGLELVFNGTTPVTTPVAVAKLDRISLPVTKGFVTLKNSANETLSVYEPGETDPSYRRFKSGVVEENQTVIALCSRKFIPVVNDTDLVYPANIGAIKLGLIALRLEDTSDLQASAQHFGQAYALLNNELRKQRGAARPSARWHSGVRPVRNLT